jgi:hypothetical protein
VVEINVDLIDGHRDPSGRSARGAFVDTLADHPNLVVAAPTGQAVAVRFSVDGQWGPWTELEAELGEGPDAPATGPVDRASWTGDPSREGPRPTILAFGPVRVPAGATALELVQVLAPSNGAPFATSPPRGPVTVTFLADAAPQPDGPSVLGQRIVAGADQPAIIERSSWTSEGWASDNAGCGGGPVYADDLRAAVVHHTVNSNSYGADQVDDLLRSIWYAHVRVNGWCDIGYNFVVDRFGRIWEARTGGIARPVIGGHARGFNTATVGIALLGQHQPGASPAATAPSGAARTSLQALVAWKLGIHGVDPAGTAWLRNQATSGRLKLAGNSWHRVPTVLGHRDLGFTSCPGDHGIAATRSLTAPLAAGRQTTPPYTFEAWVAAPDGPGFVTVDARGGIRPSGSATIAGIGVPGTGEVAGPHPVAVAAERSGSATRGYVLNGDGSLTAFGGAPASPAPAPGGGGPVDVALAAGGGGWVVSADGSVRGFGGAADRSVQGGGAAVAAAIDGAGNGYLLEAGGGLRAVGSAPPVGGPHGIHAIDLALRPSGDSGWVLASDGSVHSFGGAAAMALNGLTRIPAGRSARAVVASGSGGGGWVMTDDGQLWPFGRERLVFPLATDTSSADAVDVAVTASVLSPEFRAGREDEYFAALGTTFLHRPPTDDEMAHWQWLLTYEGGRTPVTLGLARSDEWSGSVIDRLYSDVLGRPADAGGRRYWLQQMRSGLSVQNLMVYFYGSREYYLTSGSAGGYVDRLYRVLLQREADQGGGDYWRRLLEGGRAQPADVAAGFVVSPESRRMRITGLYHSILGRAPDPAGREYWVDRLLSADDIVLAAELAASDEFHGRATS